jgi:hypothetical protein
MGRRQCRRSSRRSSQRMPIRLHDPPGLIARHPGGDKYVPRTPFRQRNGTRGVRRAKSRVLPPSGRAATSTIESRAPRNRKPPFALPRAHSGRRRATDQPPRFHAPTGLSAQIGPSPHLANLGYRGIVDRGTLWPDRLTALRWRGWGGSSMCLLAARSAVTCKRTGLPLAWGSSQPRRRPPRFRSGRRLFHKGDGPEIVCDRAPRPPVRVETNQSRGPRGGPLKLS